MAEDIHLIHSKMVASVYGVIGSLLAGTVLTELPPDLRAEFILGRVKAQETIDTYHQFCATHGLTPVPTPTI